MYPTEQGEHVLLIVTGSPSAAINTEEDESGFKPECRGPRNIIRDETLPDLASAANIRHLCSETV